MFSLGWTFGPSLLLTLLIKLFSISILVFLFRPVWLIKLWQWSRVLRAGLSKNCIKITDELEISYYERRGKNNDEVLLFVHGLTGDKGVYCDVVRLLTKDCHVIVIDLPGHGESKPNDIHGDYTIDSQVESLYKFVKAFGFGEKSINLVGVSMGGHIAGVYAARYGDTLSSVVLLCPAGIKAPEVTDFFKKSRKELENSEKTNGLLPRTAQDMQAMLKLVLYHEVKMPNHIAGAFLELKKPRMDTNWKIFNDILLPGQHYILDSVLEDIQVPLLCIWGKHDQILHVSGSEVIKQRVKNAEVHIVERCGHAITIDRPRKLLKIMVDFLEKITNN